ncbi:MAG: hypothetical protein CMJ48_14480 [Planctomycetaceae bacterium]|nr:hypothetical protein [Planctomycetaceae bacterium]
MNRPPQIPPPEPTRAQRIVLALLRPNTAILLVLVVLLLSSPLIYRASRLSGLPDIPPPFDLNRYGTVTIDPKDNAHEFYKKASPLLIGESGLDADEYEQALEEGWPAASEDVRKWVADNQPAIALWREGTAKPDALGHQPKDSRIDLLLPSIQTLRVSARLAVLDGSRLEAEGQPQEAWGVYRALFRSSRHCGRHGTMIERLVGIAIHAIVVESIQKWAANPDVDSEMLRRALDQVSTDYEMTALTSTAFQSEYFMAMSALDDPNLVAFLKGGMLGRLRRLGPSVIGELPTGPVLFLCNEPELSRRVTKHAFANWLAQVDKPRHARTRQHGGYLKLFDPVPGAKAGTLTPAELEKHFMSSLVARILLPAMSNLDAAVTREQAKQACLVVILAAHAYHRDHGEFPGRIEDLRDGYLDKLPADPFGKADEAIHYRRIGERGVVWSIDDDQLDDGGDVEHVQGSPDPGDLGYEFAPPEGAEVRAPLNRRRRNQSVHPDAVRPTNPNRQFVVGEFHRVTMPSGFQYHNMPTPSRGERVLESTFSATEGRGMVRRRRTRTGRSVFWSNGQDGQGRFDAIGHTRESRGHSLAQPVPVARPIARGLYDGLRLRFIR